MKLRPYQSEAVASILDEFREVDSTLAVMPTGCGKTIVFSHVIDQFQNGRCMVLAHREELITQAADKIERVTGIHCEIEMASQMANLNHLYHGEKPVIVSSIQTQISGYNGDGRMQRFSPRDFGLLIIDEAHHAPASSYRRVLDYYKNNPDLKVLGVTATPDRADELALGQIFDTVAYEYGVVNAIEDGWLVPIRQQSVVVDDLDFSGIKTTAGDLNGRQLADLMEGERILHEVAGPTLEICNGRKTLIFTSSVAHAERLCEILNRHQRGSAEWVCGKTPKDRRREIVGDFATGVFPYLCNVGCFTEGFDDPSIEYVVLARPTKSRALFSQMVGRGTRPLPGLVDGVDTPEGRKDAISRSEKPRVHVIDFVGNCGKHKLVTVGDILGGRYGEAVLQRIKKKAQQSGGVDVLETLDEAEEELREEYEQRIIYERKLRQGLKAKADWRTYEIDAFNVLQVEPQPEKKWNVGRPPTEKQVAFLARNGVDPKGMTFTEASTIIDEVITRRKQRMCSYNQARVLARHGYDTGVSFVEASKIIDTIIKQKRAMA